MVGFPVCGEERICRVSHLRRLSLALSFLFGISGLRPGKARVG